MAETRWWNPNYRIYKIIQETILDFIRPKEHFSYGIHDVSGLKLLTGVILNFSHLNEHKFRHNFKDSINPMCRCGFKLETTNHYLLGCKLYTDLYTINWTIHYKPILKNVSEEQLVNILLFGSEKLIQT